MRTNIKIILGGRSTKYATLRNQLESSGFIVHECQPNPLTIQFEVLEKRAQVVFIDTAVTGSDILINHFAKMTCRPYVYAIVSSQRETPISIREDSHTTILRAPIEPEAVCSELCMRFSDNAAKDMHSEYLSFLHNYISEVLLRLFITPNYSGYIFLREAIKIAVCDETQTRSLSKTIYPKLAAEHGATPSGVERNIRTVISKGWTRTSASEKTEFFGSSAANPDWRPTNAEFIMTVADKIIRQTEMMNDYAFKNLTSA